MKPAKRAGLFVAERVERARDGLRRRGPLAPRVHDVRRDLRKARAALKLLRPALAKRAYKKENTLCREASRLLAPARDAQALAAAFRRLRLNAPGVSRTLARDAREAAEALDPAESLTLLSIARSEARRLSPSRSGWKGLKDGLLRSYASARRAWKRARRTAEAADFHEWRKRVKDERYQLELLGRDARDLERLSDILGDEHDLVVLRGKLHAAEVEALRAIGRKQALLRERALALAERLYVDTPGAYERRVHKAWKRSRDLKE